MSLTSWIRSLLNRPSAPVSPTLSPLTPSPVSTHAAPTKGERAGRQQQQEQSFLLWLADDFHQAMQEGRDLADAPSAELLRCVWMLGYNTAEQQRARQWGHTADEMRLIAEAQELEATTQHLLWQHALCERFGLRIGVKLSQHQIEPGMTEEMVLAAYGAPVEGAVSAVSSATGAYILRYGQPDTGTLIEVWHGVVAWVRLGTAAFPAHVYDLPALTGPDGLLRPHYPTWLS